MFAPIKLGGRITVILTLFWGTCLYLYLLHGRLSAICEPVVGIMTLPLGLIDGINFVFVRRGVIGLGEFFASLAMMIPNLFILGYGSSAILKALRRSSASSTGVSGIGQKIEDAEQAAASDGDQPPNCFRAANPPPDAL